jgi:hypothetical protein
MKNKLKTLEEREKKRYRSMLITSLGDHLIRPFCTKYFFKFLSIEERALLLLAFEP